MDKKKHTPEQKQILREYLARMRPTLTAEQADVEHAADMFLAEIKAYERQIEIRDYIILGLLLVIIGGVFAGALLWPM